MNKFFQYLVLFIAALLCSADAFPQVTQTLRVTIDESNDDNANFLVVDNAGNIYITGTFFPGVRRIRTVKYSPNGTILWNKIYSGLAFDNIVAGIVIDGSGNIVIGGDSEGTDGLPHFLLIKYNSSNGDSIFVRRKPRPSEAFNFTKDANDNFYIAGDGNGSSGFAMFAQKYNSAGDSLWNVMTTGGGFLTIDTDAQGNVFVAGDLSGTSSKTAKINSIGTVQWTATTPFVFGNSPKGKELIKHDAAGNVYAAGERYIDGVSREDLIISKYSDAGTELWNRRFVNDGRNDYAGCLTLDNSGNAIIAGYSYNPAASAYDLLMLKYDPSGNLLWSKFFTRATPHAFYPYAMTCDAANNLYVSGGAVECFTVKFNPAGDTLWTAFTSGLNTAGINRVNDMTLDASGNVYICGTMTNSGSNHDMFVIRYSQNLSPVQQISETATEFSLQQNYPNPFNPSTKIKFTVSAEPGDKQVKLSVYNAVGSLVRVLVDGKLNAGEYETDFNAEGLSSGIYFCKMETGNYSGTRKMILIR